MQLSELLVNKGEEVGMADDLVLSEEQLLQWQLERFKRYFGKIFEAVEIRFLLDLCQYFLNIDYNVLEINQNREKIIKTIFGLIDKGDEETRTRILRWFVFFVLRKLDNAVLIKTIKSIKYEPKERKIVRS